VTGATGGASSEGRIRVVIVDDHAVLRAGLEHLLGGEPDLEVVGTAAGGAEAVALVREVRPDVVLMDLQMPKMSGLEATRELLSAQPQVRVVVLSGQVTPASAKEAMVLGAAGFLLKEEDPGDLPQRIRIVAAGGTAWSEAATELRAATGQA
jgi:DNA-binding NarL/FixJ family response regulator